MKQSESKTDRNEQETEEKKGEFDFSLKRENETRFEDAWQRFQRLQKDSMNNRETNETFTHSANKKTQHITFPFG